MKKVKKILYLTCDSNFEMHRKLVMQAAETLSDMDGYALFVTNCYGFSSYFSSGYEKGEKSIFEFAKLDGWDGALIDSDIGNIELIQTLVDTLKSKGTPVVSINVSNLNCPSYILDNRDAITDICEHMISVHGVSKINLVTLERDNASINENMLAGYKNVLKAHGIPFDERRVFEAQIGVPQGRNLYYQFAQKGVDDADAVILFHDILALGLIDEMRAHGVDVPNDVKIASLRFSTNSLVFRPDITGAAPMQQEIADAAIKGLVRMIDGEEISEENTLCGKIYYGRSCGCTSKRLEGYGDGEYCSLIFDKIGRSGQLNAFMKYTGSLEQVESLSELGTRIKDMEMTLGCGEFLCMINNDSLSYFDGVADSYSREGKTPYDEKMYVVAGGTKEEGSLAGTVCGFSDIVPFEVKSGDVFVLHAIHRNEQPFGYMVYINNLLPCANANYRICQDSIGDGFMQLRRHEELKKTIDELEHLHMTDAMTGLKNRYGLEKLKDDYINEQPYMVVMMDIDGLKYINDTFGHLMGNHAICLVAKVVSEYIHDADLVVRYGGDEFVVISKTTDKEFWEKAKKSLNETLKQDLERQKQQYQVGVSIGYAGSTEEKETSFDMLMELADKRMYEDKALRKIERGKSVE